MEETTLLEKAKETKVGKIPKEITPEVEQLVLEWVKGKITITQIARIYGVNNGNVYVLLSRVLKEYVKKV